MWVWFQVCYACVRAEEFRLAGVCGLHILKHPDHVEELIQHYERAGHPTELIQLMEQVSNKDTGCLIPLIYILQLQ